VWITSRVALVDSFSRSVPSEKHIFKPEHEKFLCNIKERYFYVIIMQLNILGFTILDTSPHQERTVTDEASLNKIYKIHYGVW
jgi:hypothetical protein